MPPPALLFVCLGNICRSPLAEAAFRDAAGRAGLEAKVDSAGTGDWHIGSPPDRRAMTEALRHGVDISAYRARQISPDDFHRFDFILALDRQNLTDLQAVAPADGRARISLLLDHVAGMEGRSVADPYFGDDTGFVETWREVSLGAEALVRELKG